MFYFQPNLVADNGILSLYGIVMARRTTKNTTGIPRIEGLTSHDAWISYSCVQCQERNFENIGQQLFKQDEAYEKCRWMCSCCHTVHANDQELPFDSWPEAATEAEGTPAQRFWKAFFRSCTEKPEVYWKQCNACGRVLPNQDFSRHVNWGPLEKQLECRACKAVINAKLNPKRTSEQLRESAAKRRIAELLMEANDEKLDVLALFKRFDSRCFKTDEVLDIKNSASWQIDHTIPSRYFYPLSIQNATLLSKDANQNKSGKWPSEFYTNSELVKLARITGADLSLLASRTPINNPHIDVNLCVSRYLNVRGGADLTKRINELKELLEKNQLINLLSTENLKLLGLG